MPYTVAVRSPYFASRKIARCPYDFYTITVQAPHDVPTVASRRSCDMYNRAGIARAPFDHPEVPIRRPQSVSSKIYKRRAFGIIVGRKEDDRDEYAVNTCSRCEAGEPKAAAVDG